MIFREWRKGMPYPSRVRGTLTDALPAKPGDDVLVAAYGYEPFRLKITPAHIKRGRLMSSLYPCPQQKISIPWPVEPETIRVHIRQGIPSHGWDPPLPGWEDDWEEDSDGSAFYFERAFDLTGDSFHVPRSARCPIYWELPRRVPGHILAPREVGPWRKKPVTTVFVKRLRTAVVELPRDLRLSDARKGHRLLFNSANLDLQASEFDRACRNQSRWGRRKFKEGRLVAHDLVPGVYHLFVPDGDTWWYAEIGADAICATAKKVRYRPMPESVAVLSDEPFVVAPGRLDAHSFARLRSERIVVTRDRNRWPDTAWVTVWTEKRGLFHAQRSTE